MKVTFGPRRSEGAGARNVPSNKCLNARGSRRSPKPYNRNDWWQSFPTGLRLRVMVKADLVHRSTQTPKVIPRPGGKLVRKLPFQNETGETIFGNKYLLQKIWLRRLPTCTSLGSLALVDHASGPTENQTGFEKHT
ncbi:predicted protein [Histoplasma capsulatum H143]|uniref:Uncharacterized protein n=1 Tax=Ajellomyces capsulatus (strain H143) TaxID=544712 RepID=C6HEX7_AJECH|nr:predicted protein [Histoplasma capsulatum H143]